MTIAATALRSSRESALANRPIKSRSPASAAWSNKSIKSASASSFSARSMRMTIQSGQRCGVRDIVETTDCAKRAAKLCHLDPQGRNLTLQKLEPSAYRFLGFAGELKYTVDNHLNILDADEGRIRIGRF